MATVFWIGVGNMGYPITCNLIKAGHTVLARDADAEKMSRAVEAGCRAATDIDEAIRKADIVFTMLPNSEILLDVILGKDGLAREALRDKILVDMSTVSVDASRRCAEAISAHGALFLRAPVNGSTVFAREARLTVIASGPRAAYDKTLPLLEVMSQHRFYMGEKEEARIVKLAINMMVATTSSMFSESAVLCEKAGMDWETVLDVFMGSAIASPQLGFKIPPLRKRDFTPAFTTRLMAKDIGLALDAAKELGVYAPIAATTKQLLEAAIARGDADKDFSSLLLVIESMSGVK